MFQNCSSMKHRLIDTFNFRTRNAPWRSPLITNETLDRYASIQGWSTPISALSQPNSRQPAVIPQLTSNASYRPCFLVFCRTSIQAYISLSKAKSLTIIESHMTPAYSAANPPAAQSTPQCLRKSSPAEVWYSAASDEEQSIECWRLNLKYQLTKLLSGSWCQCEDILANE